MRPPSFLSQLAMVSLLLCSSALTAQGSGPAPRIRDLVEESSLTTLKGGVPLFARAQFDRGEAAASTQLTHVRLVLSRSSEQQAALDKFMAELQDKSSANYQKWVTPEQFGKLYGPTDSDIAAIVAWIESRGLTVEAVSPGRTNIAFSGKVKQVEEALHTPIHSFEMNGEAFVSNVTEPRIPTALTPVVTGVARLNTIKPKPHHVPGKAGKFDPRLGRLVPVNSGAAGGARAQYTTGTGTSNDPYFLYLVPGDAATIYNAPNSLNANFSTGGSYTGKGVTIGIGGDAAIQASTVMGYQNRFTGAANGVTITNIDGVTANGDTDEGYIDTELASGLAPGAAIHFYAATSVDLAIERAINDNAVDIFSLSFGACEQGLTTADNALINSRWQQAAAQGIAVTVSSGDSGSAACDDPLQVYSAQYGLKVNGYASTPFNVAVGGTDLAGLLSSFTTYADTVNSAGNLFRTATSYIPESTWNNSPVNDFGLSANVPYFDSSHNSNIVAGGGGASNCSTNADATGVCSSGYAKPSWQRGTGVPADSARDLPDISLMSGNGVDSSAWLVCTDDPVTGGSARYNCAAQTDNSFFFNGFGGTSTATPAFAGILALVQEKTGGRLGQSAKELYDLYNGTNGSAIFQDVTQGNISVVCVAASTDCSRNSARWYFLTGYDATPGYDLATGLGSVNATELVNSWSTSIGSGASTVTVAPSVAAVGIDQGLTVVVTVTGSLGMPFGTVTLTGGGYTSPSQALLDGSSTFTIAAGSLAKGVDSLIATYSGNVSYASHTGTASVTVNALTPMVTVTPSASSLYTTVALTVTGTVTGPGAVPTGTVTLSGGGYTSTPKPLSSSAYSIDIPANSLSIGRDALTVSYSGDSNYETGSHTASVVVMPGTFTLSAADVTLTAGATSTNAATITVTPIGGYTGTITLTAAVTASPAGSNAAPTLTGSTVTISGAAAGTGAITVASIASAARIRAALTKGSGWFGAAGGTGIAALFFFLFPGRLRRWRKVFSAGLLLAVMSFAAVGCKGFWDPPTTTTSTKATPTVTVTPAKTSIAVTDALSVSVTVTGTGTSPTGTVTLSSGSYTSAATTLASGAATIIILANSLAAGATDTLTVTYSGDTNYDSASGTASVTVSKTGTAAGAYTVTVTGTGNDAAATTATTTFTLTVN